MHRHIQLEADNLSYVRALPSMPSFGMKPLTNGTTSLRKERQVFKRSTFVTLRLQVYSFSKGRIQLSNKRFAGTVEHDYELLFDRETEIHEIDNSDDIPTTRTVQYSSLRSINMSTKLLPFVCNVLCVVHSYQQPRTIQSKTSSESRQRRIMTIVDATRYALDVTLWGDLCNVADSLLDTHPVVSMANLQIREWNGKAGSTLSSTEVQWGPDTEAAVELKKWYNEHALDEEFKSLNTGGPGGAGGTNTRPVKDATLKEMCDEMDSVAEVDDVRNYRVHAYVMKLLYRSTRQDNQFICIYPRCSKCGRKISENSEVCGCGAEAGELQRGLALGCLLADASCSGVRVGLFHDQAQILLGKSANQIADWVDASKSDMHPELNELFEDTIVWKRYLWTIRGKRDQFRNQFRNNYAVVGAVPYTAGACAAACMTACLKLVPNIFDGAVNKRLFPIAENVDLTPSRKRQCLDAGDSVFLDASHTAEGSVEETPPIADDKMNVAKQTKVQTGLDAEATQEPPSELKQTTPTTYSTYDTQVSIMDDPPSKEERSQKDSQSRGSVIYQENMDMNKENLGA
eukprot:Gregarina_sp_Poly_1__10039@NODE_673_length_6834_cov_120_707699_g375_i1_p2_GENE_NODE_673_length_6834_cov_120_707699_g375_i1NODE_673_length_6834_cov_120_707699_g375_i1_p2_ORF_typecomplete_len571_score68_65REPA_OB_2/PF16900_5/2_8e17REPA_OB_2/PF16900_5/1_4e02Rep_facA_C/PF08646_10/2_6e11DUF223/PF02721_14/0_0027DUF223/PF02721_14/4_7e02BRCA2_OB3/PF09104_10/0_1BRCA2_OB3/PF09104_10/1_1e02zinc_ribbon_2/PF13240_6/0_0044zinc_ribbon_2/PF13240_6/8_7e03POT1PC/PF16686_5/0_17_NODE_673_length_6834_cov_120_707699_